MSLDTLDLFFGDANAAQARVYARCQNATGSLTGKLVGPECAFARTLPAQIPFMSLAGEQPLAEAIVPDPCFWTPELPFLYRANLQVDGNATERTLGLRRLGVRNRHLHFDGKRFVLRAVRTRQFEIASQFARETWTALVVENPADELCEFASRQGVLLFADLTIAADVSDLGTELRRLARWPAVAIALLRGTANLPPEIRARIPNLLLAQSVSENDPIAPWAQLAFVESTDLSKFAQLTIPIIAVRQLSEPISIEQSRAACDALQSELASHGDFAGYVV